MFRRFAYFAAAVALIVALPACSSAPATPTAAPAGQAPSPAPTSQAPTVQAKPAATAAPTATSTPEPAAKPTTAAAPSASQLSEKAKGLTEYSFDAHIDAAGQTITATYHVKGDKIRQQISVAGQESALLLDTTKQTAYMLLPAEKMAMKLDFSQAASRMENPGQRAKSLPANARVVGTETIDGKQAVVYEVPDGAGQGKFWMWADRGLPLKIETSTPEGKVTVLFTNYDFSSQPDSLFELPADTEIVDLPIGIPGGVGGLPTATP